MAVVRRYPLLVFFVLAYAFSWWPWPLYILGLSPSPIIGFGPFFAAILVIVLTGGKAGVVALLRRMCAGAWAGVVCGGAACSGGNPLIATVLNVMMGAPAPTSRARGLAQPLPQPITLLLVPGIGGTWEEPGWRGYALPYLQVGRSALSAA